MGFCGSMLGVLLVIVALLKCFVIGIKYLFLIFVPRSFLRKDIKGQVVLITGAGSGLGRLVALRLASRGAIIISWDISEKGNAETKRLIDAEKGICHTFVVDICDKASVYDAARQVKNAVGKVDILVNNAGIVTGKNFLDCSDDMILKTFKVNTLSHFWTVKAFLPDMMSVNQGHIVTISSLAGLVGAHQLTDYCASKFAAVGFHEALRVELDCEGHTGVKTTVICPYFTNTGMFAGVKSRLLPILEPEFVATEIADAILMNKQQLILPIFARFLICLKNIAPQSIGVEIFKAVTGDASLKAFTGRKMTPQVEIR